MTQDRRVQEEDVPERAEVDPGAVAEGDGQLDISAPNVTETQPPSPSMTDDGEREREGADGRAGDGEPDSEDAERIESDLEGLQRDFASLSDRHLRLAAEFDNYRRRVERERTDAYARAQAELAGRLLEALDDLERVTHHAEGATAATLLEGVQLVERKLHQALKAAGLEAVDAEGARFDPNSMEAVAMVEAGPDEEDDVVSDVFQRGYRFGGTLIRPARVRVKKHGA